MAETKIKPREEEGKIIQLIIFKLGDEEFGVKIDEVREIIRMAEITTIPDTPAFIKGVTNVRGEIVSVIDLRERFSLREDKPVESKHIIITEQTNNIFGLMVDEVIEVLRIPEGEIKQTPDIVTKIHEEYVSGVVTLESRLIILLAMGKVLSEEELVELTDMSRKQEKKEENEEKPAGRRKR